jgi:(1->4)-alpha-D-glucan 1-alpha-D-glucosylmutase
MPRVPSATYRLQFNRLFTFADARQRLAYLDQLGISDVYASPYLRARAESTHGYDIADHNQLNPVVGDEGQYDALVTELHARGMGQILDVVPNHMGIGESTNSWWMDVLENGPSSRFAPYFDIDWHPLKTELENKVLLPILGQQYGRVLENCELVLVYEDGAFFLRYWQTDLPINPRTYVDILRLPLEQLIETLGSEHEQVLEYQSIMTGLEHLPPRTETERAKVVERSREKEILKRRLAALADATPDVRAAIEQTVQHINGERGDPRSFDLLDALIERQAYRLSYWRVAAEEINYRRFFDVNDLAAIRMDRSEVFEATHKLVLRLLAEGKISGLRVDHPDGLWDPAGYFQRLQESYLEAVGDGGWGMGDGEPGPSQPPTPIPHPPRALYIVAEKILARGERLPEDWAVHGTSGYDYLNALNGIFVDGSAEKRFSEIYADFIGTRLRFDDLVYATRKQIMQVSMASEVNVLTYQLKRVSERNRYYRDFTLYSLRGALRELIACFPVYRTYIVATTEQVQERDRIVIETAVNRARSRNPTIEPSIYDFLRDILLLRYPDTLDPEAREEQRTFVMKFQQLTGPVMAKGMEDTAFYIYNRLTSLNEVGGEPQRFGTTMAAFHRQNQERLRDWPAAMLATSTHDTKRSEDVRARISVLSELPEQWRKALTRWSRWNRRKKIDVDGKPAPQRNEEYLLYQTLLGIWPFESIDDQQRTTNDESNEQGLSSSSADRRSSEFIERIQSYMVKAIREAKVNTSWLNPNTSYDQAVRTFVAAILEDTPGNRFLADFRSLHATVAHFGAFNALSQTLLKLTSPGVPDIYQGSEIWDFSLVDPDNRRAVDYDLRAWWLGELIDTRGNRIELARTLVDSKADGRIKLYLTHRTLQFRREHADLFRAGSYVPLDATGDASEHIVAFARSHGAHSHAWGASGAPIAGEEALIVAPRLLAKRLREPNALPLGSAAWGDALLALPNATPGQRYRDIFTDRMQQVTERDGVIGLPLAELLENFPVALLERLA